MLVTGLKGRKKSRAIAKKINKTEFNIIMWGDRAKEMGSQQYL